MFKQKLSSLLLGAAFLLGSGTNAVAGDFISVGVSVPVAIAADDATVDSVSGQMVYVKLPFLGGLGMESYDFTVKGSNGSDLTYGVTMADVFYQFPIPIVNITLGVGVGSLTPKDDLEANYDAGAATQVFGRVGIPFGLFDVHLSSHRVSGKFAGKNTVSDVDLSFSTTALGVSLGF